MNNHLPQELHVAYTKALQAAREEARDAEEALRAALVRVRDAQERVIHATLRFSATPSDAAEWLAREAYSRKAQASGGITQATNIVETIQRDAAVSALARVRFD